MTGLDVLFLLSFLFKVYMLSMDGPLFECDVYQMNCTQIFDLVKELNIPASAGEQPHFKAAHSVQGRLFVASNTFEEVRILHMKPDVLASCMSVPHYFATRIHR